MITWVKTPATDDAHVGEITVEFQPTQPADDRKQQRRPGIKRKFVKFWKKRKRSWSSLRASMKIKTPRVGRRAKAGVRGRRREAYMQDVRVRSARWSDPNEDIPIRERLVIQAEVKEDTTPRLSKKERIFLMRSPNDVACSCQDSSANQYGPERQRRRLLPQEEACLAESFNVFIDYCLELLQKHRDLFPLTHEEAGTQAGSPAQVSEQLLV
ncbi:hypothetical protein MTO96_036391 [Rhipicephalus appendiculatus]